MVPRAVLSLLLLGCGFLLWAQATGDKGNSADPANRLATTQRTATADRPLNVARPQLPLKSSSDGFEVITDTEVPAVGRGRVITYTVEVGPDLESEANALSDKVAQAFADRRGWRSEVRLARVDDPTAAIVRIVLADPVTVDSLCSGAGYFTAGQYSCWNGRFAALNAMRWRHAAPGFDSLDQYRTYQVNHEVGHALGYGHEYCSGPGATAPVMMQQTKGLLGCEANPWP